MELFDQTVIIAMALIFVGSFVQTAIGFGLAIVAAPLLFLVSPDYVPAPICLIGLFISIFNAMKHRSNISIGGLKVALLGRIPGSLAGGALLVMVSTSVLSLWLGLLVVFAVIVSLLPFRLEPTPAKMGIAGFFSGFFGTSSGIVVRQWRYCCNTKMPINCVVICLPSSYSAQLSRWLFRSQLAFLRCIIWLLPCHCSQLLG